MKRIVLLFGLFSLSVGTVWAQSLTELADRQFDQLAFTKAAELYEQVLTNPAPLPKQERLALKARLAYSYQQAHDTKNAERMYRALIDESDSLAEHPRYQLYYAQALAGNGKYREAQVAYSKYNELLSADKHGTVSAKSNQTGSLLTRTASTYTVDFLAMNTGNAEFSPMLYEDGLVLVTESKGRKSLFKRHNASFLDLCYFPNASLLTGTNSLPNKSLKTKPLQLLGSDTYTRPTANDSKTVGWFAGIMSGAGFRGSLKSGSEPFSRILNSKYHEGPATFSNDGSQVIFTRNNYNEGQYRESKDGINKLKLFTATRINGLWSNAKELPLNSEEFSTGHPALAKGRTGEPDQLLYFSSDRPGGFGGSDVYVSAWTNGQWGKPVNLGERVNSKGNELFPFVDEKGNLYVASDGHGGLGGLDMFYIKLAGASEPVGQLLNLGKPLNSPQDDFGLVTDSERGKGYFSSNRKNGGGDDDVYRFTRINVQPACRELTIRVIDANTKEPLANTLLQFDSQADTGEKELTTDAEGLVRVCLAADSENRFVVTQDGYLSSKIGFSARDMSDRQSSTIEIQMIKRGDKAETGISTGAARHNAVEPYHQPEVDQGTRSSVVGKMLAGQVLTQTHRKPIAAVMVTIENECDGTVQQTMTDVDGQYQFQIQPNCNYRLNATKEHMGTLGSYVTNGRIESSSLLMFQEGDIMTIDNIHYDRNQSAIRPDAAVELDKVVVLMNKYPAMAIEMRSHTDSRATALYNQRLSDDRARSAAAYLVSKGVAPIRVIARGFGESALLNKCTDGVNCSEIDHQFNRRTEIKILIME